VQTSIAIPVGHKSLRLRQLQPKLSAAFSPNLYRWMRASAHFYSDGGVAEAVYRVKLGSLDASYLGAGTLMIGYPMDSYSGDKDFSGVRLIGVLCNGSGERRACYANLVPDLEPVEGFWERYLAIGRCAIDPDHQEHFIGGERFQEGEILRTCLWCGATQRKAVEAIQIKSWVSV
jgi:hypothetical protein